MQFRKAHEVSYLAELPDGTIVPYMETTAKLTGRPIIDLTIKRKWFEMIASGEKREEYRDLTPRYHSRLGEPTWSWSDGPLLRLRNGYNRESDAMILEVDNIHIGLPNPAWWPENEPLREVYIIQLGKRLI